MLLSTPYALTCNDIKEALLKQNILTDVNEIKILAKPPHRLRDWNKQIHNFIIHEGHKPILHLEISPDLSARFNQTTEFNKAFSEHSIAPISFF